MVVLINKSVDIKPRYFGPNFPFFEPLTVIFSESAVTVSAFGFASKRLLTMDRYTFKMRG